MTDEKTISEQFESKRDHLRAVAYRMLGSSTEAEDAVQEAWLRLGRSDAGAIENLGGWLTTVVARVCLDMLRSRKSRREELGIPHEPVASDAATDHDLMLADSVGAALLVVLETLDPAERLAFVLHDTFGVSFDEIAMIVGRTPAAARQLASRARRRVQGASPSSESDRARQREIVDAFLAASRAGDFTALLTLLDPDVVVRADAAAVALGAQAEVRGAQTLVGTFLGRAKGARAATVDGLAGAAWIVGGKPRAVFDFTIRDGKIARIDVLASPETLGAVELVMLGT